ncbi:MAG TPA: hypothetical protein VGR56_06090 [Nitrososphaerales archaeon]|nr:hypothetical protein [Nitrososphaerales archaeon]
MKSARSGTNYTRLTSIGLLILLTSLVSLPVHASSTKTGIFTMLMMDTTTGKSLIPTGQTLSADGDSAWIMVMGFSGTCTGTTVSVFVTDPNGNTWKDKVSGASAPLSVFFPDDFPAGANTLTPGTYYVWAQVTPNTCNGVSNIATFIAS